MKVMALLMGNLLYLYDASVFVFIKTFKECKE